MTTNDKWQHLVDLVEFARALMDVIERINSQSFNHFMLRIGKYQANYCIVLYNKSQKYTTGPNLDYQN